MDVSDLTGFDNSTDTSSDSMSVTDVANLAATAAQQTEQAIATIQSSIAPQQYNATTGAPVAPSTGMSTAEKVMIALAVGALLMGAFHIHLLGKK